MPWQRLARKRLHTEARKLKVGEDDLRLRAGTNAIPF